MSDMIVGASFASDSNYPDFRYMLVLTGPFTEYAVSSFNGIDFEKHTVEPYGKPGAELCVTAMADVIKYIVESVLIPFDPNQNARQFRVPGDRVTWEQLIRDLGDIQGVKYKLMYLDPREAGVKQEEARKNKDEEAEVFWVGKAIMLNGSGVIPDPLDTVKFSFTLETAKETLRRLFGKK
ncbi:hypothetical protein B0H10DRAFT_1966755 [Mycena sp. CBHHK59/15]|nr:hypothetical protein B0H10DRAFT_1966755 [Mycena sp. CBHHK59/15]